MGIDSIAVLLVEDNRDDENLALRAFTASGLQPPVVARDGAEAIKAMQANEAIGLVLLDIRLPKLSGLEVLRWIRSNDRRAHVPVVMLTSTDEESDVALSYALGANCFVTKPVDFFEYLATVKSVLRFWLGRASS